MLLKDIYDKKHFHFCTEALSWQDSIRECCKPLVAEGVVEPVYAEEIIACVEKHGPYIVILPDIALPHSTENAKGCKGTAIGFMKSKEAVHFEEGNPEKDAHVFFTLCSTNPDEHMANMQRLYTILTNNDAVEALKKAEKPEDLLAIDAMIEAAE